MRRVVPVVPTETTPFVADGATFVRKELPDCAVVVEPAPNATELLTLEVASLPIATLFVAVPNTLAVLPIAIPFVAPTSTVATLPTAIP